MAQAALRRGVGGSGVQLDGAGVAEVEGLLDGDVEEAELLQLLGPGQRADVERTQAAVGGEPGDLLLGGLVVAGDQHVELLAELRGSQGLDPDPMGAYARSGHDEKIVAERVGGAQAGWGA